MPPPLDARTDPKPPTTLTWALPLAVALWVRVAFVLESADDPIFASPLPGLDVDLHWQAARALRAGGHGVLEWQMMSAPLHALLVAVGQALLGESMLRLRLASAGVGAVTVALLSREAAALSGTRRGGLAAGLLAAVLPTLVYYDGALLKSSFELLLLAGMVALARRILDDKPGHPQRLAGLGLGLCAGLLLLSQRGALLGAAGVALALAAGASSTQKALGRLALPGLVVVTLLFGFALRGRLAGHIPPALAEACLPTTGVHLRIGMSETATGTYAALPGVPPLARGHAFDARLRVELAVGHPLLPAEADGWYRAQALGFVRAHPGQAARLLVRKLRLFVSDVELKDNDPLWVLRERHRALAAPVGMGLLACLAALALCAPRGAFPSLRRVRWVLAALVAGPLLACLLTFVTSRYRVHVLVPLLVLAGVGTEAACRLVEDSLRLARSGRRGAAARGLLLPSVAVLAAAALAYAPLPRGFQVTAASGTWGEALQERQAAAARSALARLSPRRGDDPEARLARAGLLMQLARYSEAQAILDEEWAAALRAPGEPRGWQALRGHVMQEVWLGRYARLRDDLARLQKAAPQAVALLTRGHASPVAEVLERFVLPP